MDPSCGKRAMADLRAVAIKKDGIIVGFKYRRRLTFTYAQQFAPTFYSSKDAMFMHVLEELWCSICINCFCACMIGVIYSHS